MLNSTVSKQENGKLSVERTCPALVLPPMQEEARVALARLSVLLLRKGSRRGGWWEGTSVLRNTWGRAKPRWSRINLPCTTSHTLDSIDSVEGSMFLTSSQLRREAKRCEGRRVSTEG